jgi:hypothetical protein
MMVFSKALGVVGEAAVLASQGEIESSGGGSDASFKAGWQLKCRIDTAGAGQLRRESPD